MTLLRALLILLALASLSEARRITTTTDPNPVQAGQPFYVIGCGYVAQRAGWAAVGDASWDDVRYLFDVESTDRHDNFGCIYWYDSPTFTAPSVPGTYTVTLCQYLNGNTCTPAGQATVTVVP